jgi:outer membrane protein assembly factor BamB
MKKIPARINVGLTNINHFLMLAIGVPGLFSTSAAALNWPQFRGSTGDGRAPSANPPIVWSATSNVTWKVELNGRGRSSPVTFGERIFLTAAVEQGVVRKKIEGDDMQTAEHVALLAVCLDRSTGKTLWEKTLFDVPQPAPVHWFNSWATPTPVTEKGRVYCDFGTFGTVCLNSQDGKLIWKEQLAIDHQVGPGSSPIVWKDLLFLVRDGRDVQYVAALDKNTGKLRWKTPRPPLTASSDNLKKSFSTPIVLEGKETQVIIPGAQWVVAYEPFTGKEIWRINHGNGFSIGTSPILAHGLVYFGTGCMKPQLWAIRPEGHETLPQENVVWKTLKGVPVMSSPTVVGDEIYWVSDDGIATCADARSGAVHWQERLGGPCLASPLFANGRIYFFRQDATAVVVKAGKQFERLSENALEGTLIATPALGDRSIYLRTDTHLYCLGK